MRISTNTTCLWLPRTPEEIFPFFADAHNLEAITPGYLRFEVLTPAPITMGVGTLIDYRLRVRGVPIRWRTRIAEWDPPRRFVDEQIRGPYRLWRHEHTFVADRGGTRCEDLVTYAVPGGPVLGRVVERLWVRRDVEGIFAFRTERLEEIFGRHWGEAPPAMGGARADISGI